MKKLQHLLALVVACMVAFTACSSSSDSSKDVVKSYLDNVIAGKYEKAASNFYFKNEPSETELKALAAKLEEGYGKDGGLKSYEIVSEEITKAEEEGGIDKARVEVKLFYKDGKESEETMKLIKKDGKWKIDFSVK